MPTFICEDCYAKAVAVLGSLEETCVGRLPPPISAPGSDVCKLCGRPLGDSQRQPYDLERVRRVLKPPHFFCRHMLREDGAELGQEHGRPVVLEILGGTFCGDQPTHETVFGPRCDKHAEVLRQRMRDPHAFLNILAGCVPSEEEIAKRVRPITRPSGGAGGGAAS